MAPVGVDVLTQLLRALRYFMRQWGLMRSAFNEDGAGAIISGARIDVLNGHTLQSLYGAGPEFEATLRLIDETQDLIELKEAISGLQGSFFVEAGKQFVGSGPTIALDVRSSHRRASALPLHDQ